MGQKKLPKKSSSDKGIKFDSTINPDANSHLSHIKLPKDRPVRIYCDGIYDLFHYGHARSLEQVKKLFPNVHLIVGCCNDELTNKFKGKTVMNEEERYESLRHCKWVDEVVRDAPWVIDQEFINKHKIDFVAHDDIPYAGAGQEDVYKFVKDQGKFIATKRTTGISTSDLITKIVYDYDTYVRRNLKRGVSARDLNISFFKEKEIKVKDSMQQLQGKIKERLKTDEEDIKHNWESSKDELIDVLQSWESKSNDFVKEFTALFDFRKMFRLSPQKRTSSELKANDGKDDDLVDGYQSPFDKIKSSAEGIKTKILEVLGRDSDK